MKTIRIGSLMISGAALAAAATLAGQTASAGGDIYLSHCASCHGTRLEGASGPAFGPALTGDAFRERWKDAAPAELVALVRDTMPLTRPRSLSERDAAEVANFLLAANDLPTAAMAEAAPASAPAPAPAEAKPDSPGREEFRDETFARTVADRQALAKSLTSVTEARLMAMPRADWLAWRGSSDAQGYSALKQIDRRNVGRLALDWSLALDPGSNAIAPIVADGIMFVNSNGTVQALDATNGDRLWKFSRPVAPKRAPNDQPRGIALHGKTLFVPTIDNHVVALDATSGKVLWDHEVGPPEAMQQVTAAPIVAQGVVVQGVSGCSGPEARGGCLIVGLDAATGDELWRFHTIARPGQPGGDSWNGVPWEDRTGGSVWGTGSYDPETGLLYFGVGQTYQIDLLLNPQREAGASNDALYTDSTVALDPKTGRLAWFYQHTAADVWDLDWAFERTLLTLPGPAGPRRVVLTGGKLGIFDALDAKTGEYLWSYDFGLQNIVTAIDPATGKKSFDPALMPVHGAWKFICPSAIGARNWMATSYDPTSHLLYVPLTPTCMDFARSEKTDPLSLENYGQMKFTPRRHPGSNGNFGWMAAFDVVERRVVWTERQRAPKSSAALATAGGLVFTGARDRTFRALDSRTGATLWQTRLPALPNAFPMTYRVADRQFVAIVVGGPTIADVYQTPNTPELQPAGSGKAIMVFALPR